MWTTRSNKEAKELNSRAADLGYSKAHYLLADINRQWGDLKKTKFHFEAACCIWQGMK
jgi:TPR repeat protein